jgi:hypothetical protein
MKGYVHEAELAEILQIEQPLLRELAVMARLPFSFTSRHGLMIRPEDVALWQQARAVRSAAR